jgi:hypothetical protein
MSEDISECVRAYMREQMAMPDVTENQEQNWIFGHMVTFALRHLATAQAETPHKEWAVERIKDMAENARINASRLGVKLLRGHGYPNEVMHDAQDALALETVLAMLASSPSTARAEEHDCACMVDDSLDWVSAAHAPSRPSPTQTGRDEA